MKKVPLLAFLFLLASNATAQFVQKDFMIGANWAPFLTKEQATPAPADYNGDGIHDLATRINTGPKQGRFQIDYSTALTPWYQKNGWGFITTAAVYGTASDPVVSGKYDSDSEADIAVYFPSTKNWKIDYKSNGFGFWDVSYDYSSNFPGVGLYVEIPVAADFDGDGKTDISFKLASGDWMIDYSANGYGSIDYTRTNCGDHTAHPVPANYDGDQIDTSDPASPKNFTADISVKTDAGEWKIDYRANGFGTWDAIITNCGDHTATPVPADYNGDKKAELSVKTSTGDWLVTYSYTSGTNVSWISTAFSHGFGGAEAVPYPADFNGDGRADFSFAFTNDGRWIIDDFWAATGGYSWSSYPGKIADDYNVANLNPADQTNYTKLKNCFFNLVTDAPLADLGHNFQKDYFLTLMDDVGLSAMLSDPYIYSFGDPSVTTTFDKATFVDHFRNQVPADLKRRIYAINLGDEPTNLPDDGRCNCNPLDRIDKWSEFFGEHYPEKPTFNNLLPVYSPIYTNSLANYELYLDDYKDNSNSPFVCFDHYPFNYSPTYFNNTYFDNLSIVKRKFKDRNLWTTMWSGFSGPGHAYPTNEQLKFMAFCPIGYGAKGLLYFPYDNLKNPTFTISINNDPILYNRIQNINLYLKNIVGPVAMHSTNIATLHKLNSATPAVTTWGYTPDAASPELISNYTGIVKDVDDTDIMIGVFAKSILTSDPKVLSVGNYYLWVMNKDTTTKNNITITLRGNYTGNIEVSPRVVNYISNPVLTYTASSGTYHSGTNTTSFLIPELTGGEGVVVKLFSAANEGCPADYDGDKIMDISIKEYDGTWLIDYSKNGFGGWDWWGTGYGDQTWHPVPADYNGDGKADISVKMDDGRWYIDYSAPDPTVNNGYGTWDFTNAIGTYGGANALPVPADYNGDGRADLSVKVDDGRWLIDYSNSAQSNNGFLGWEYASAFLTWEGADAHPVPADYNGDGKADLSIKTDDGRWIIDYSDNSALPGNGYAGAEYITAPGPYGGASAHPVPADYNGDGEADLSIKADDGRWLVDFADASSLPGNGYAGWEITPPFMYGDHTTVPFPGDFGGDKAADMSIKYSNGQWKIDYSADGFGSWNDIILNPVYNVTGVSGRYVRQQTNTEIKNENCLMNQDENYTIVSIYDITGKQYANINRFTTLRNIRSRMFFKPGIYIVKFKAGERICTSKIFF